jgi:hypothetical protein
MELMAVEELVAAGQVVRRRAIAMDGSAASAAMDEELVGKLHVWFWIINDNPGLTFVLSG